MVVPQSFYEQDARVVARAVIGMVLVRGPVALRITEAEAYPPDDSASHCRMGRTPRNLPMWGPPGHAYVYLCYGMHRMLNLVTNPDGEGAAVLIRAAEPLRGLEEVATRRNGRRGPDALAGPGKVGAALDIGVGDSGCPLFRRRSGLVLEQGEEPTQLLVGPRVGIDYATPEDVAAPLRFACGSSRSVSHRRTLERWSGTLVGMAE